MRKMKSVICCMLLSMMLTANVACGNTSGGKSESTAPNIRGKGIVKEKITLATLIKNSPFAVNNVPFSIATQQQLPDSLFMAIYVNSERFYIKIGGVSNDKRLEVLDQALEEYGTEKGISLSEKARAEFARTGWVCAPIGRLNATLESMADGRKVNSTPGFSIAHNRDNTDYAIWFRAVGRMSYIYTHNLMESKEPDTDGGFYTDVDDGIEINEGVEEIEEEPQLIPEEILNVVRVWYDTPSRRMNSNAILIADGNLPFKHFGNLLRHLYDSDFFRVEMITAQMWIALAEGNNPDEYAIMDPIEYALMPMATNYYHNDWLCDAEYPYRYSTLKVKVTGQEVEFSFPGNTYCFLIDDGDKTYTPIFQKFDREREPLVKHLKRIKRWYDEKNLPWVVEIEPYPNATYANITALISAFQILGITSYYFKF